MILAISEIDELTMGTPQDEAFDWLVNVDSVQVCPDDEEDVLQRYTMSLLYFSTNGDSWFNCTSSEASAIDPTPCETEAERFLSGADVCFWLGVTCSMGTIFDISIGKF